MANMGLIGAIGGFGKGTADVSLQALEEAKQARLENLRSRNNQETNTLNNEQRHGFAMDEADTTHGYRMAEQDQGNKQDLEKLKIGNDYSLAQLAQGNTDKAALLEKEYALRGSEPTNEQKNANYWEGKGIDAKQQYEDRTRVYGGTDSSKIQIADRLKAADVPQEKINQFLMGEADPSKMVMEYTKALITQGYDPESAKAEAAKLVGASQAVGQPTGNSGDAIQKILSANPGKDEAWAQRYIEYLKSQGKM